MPIVQVIPTFTTPAPTRADPSNFPARADVMMGELQPFVAAANTFATQANSTAVDVNTLATTATNQAATSTAQAVIATAQATAATAAATAALALASATSATSVVVGTGAKSLTLDAPGIALAPGMWVRVANTAAPSTNVMRGVVTTYNSGTRALVVDVQVVLGSGTYSAWTVSPASELLANDLKTVATRMPDSVPLIMWHAGLMRLPAQTVFTRASVGWVRGANGMWQQVAAGVPRFGYAGFTRAFLGYLSEPQSTNYLLRSQDLSNAAWTKTNATLTTAQASPDSATSAQKVAATASGVCSVAQAGASNSATGHNTISVRAKADTGSWLLLQVGIAGTTISAWFDVSTGAIGATSTSGAGLTYRVHAVEREESGFWWCELTFDNPSAQIVTHTASVVSANSATTATIGQALIFWQHQSEAVSSATSPIVTTSATVTRSADLATRPLTAPLAGCVSLSCATVFQSRMRTQPNAGTSPRFPGVWALGSFFVALRHNGTDLTLRTGNTDSAVQAITAASHNRVAMSVAATGGQSISSLNGASTINLTGAGIGTTVTYFQIGHNGGTTTQVQGYVLSMALYAHAISGGEAQAISEI